MRDANLGNGNPEQRSGFYKHLVGAPQKSAKRKRNKVASAKILVIIFSIIGGYCPREGYKVASKLLTIGGAVVDELLSP